MAAVETEVKINVWIESMNGLSTMKIKDMAVVGMWLLVEVQLYMFMYCNHQILMLKHFD